MFLPTPNVTMDSGPLNTVRGHRLRRRRKPCAATDGEAERFVPENCPRKSSAVIGPLAFHDATGRSVHSKPKSTSVNEPPEKNPSPPNALYDSRRLDIHQIPSPNLLGGGRNKPAAISTCANVLNVRTRFARSPRIGVAEAKCQQHMGRLQDTECSGVRRNRHMGCTAPSRHLRQFQKDEAEIARKTRLCSAFTRTSGRRPDNLKIWARSAKACCASAVNSLEL